MGEWSATLPLLSDYFRVARDPSLDPLPIQSAQTYSLRSVS